MQSINNIIILFILFLVQQGTILYTKHDYNQVIKEVSVSLNIILYLNNFYIILFIPKDKFYDHNFWLHVLMFICPTTICICNSILMDV